VDEAAYVKAGFLTAIAKETLDNAVVRLIYQIRSEQLEQIDNRALQTALKSCHSYTIRPELVSQLTRPRLPELGAGSALDPLAALRTYLDNRATVYETPGDYTIYHLALENEVYTWNYGIYANGLLVESCSIRTLRELTNMTLIE
jgi:hypothetical protein